MSTPFTVSLVLLVLLLGVGFALDSGTSRRKPRAGGCGGGRRSPRWARGSSGSARLRFETLPEPQRGQPGDQAQREGLEDLDRSYPAASGTPTRRCSSCSGCSSPTSTCATCRRRSSARASRATTTRAPSACGSSAAPRPTNQVLEEITIAHELTHALEDQRFGLDLEDTSGSDDAALAHLALVEGTATAVMFTYAERHFSAEQTLGGLLARSARTPATCRRSWRRSWCSPTSRASGSCSGSTRPAATTGRWSTPPIASARRPRPSRSCTRRSTCRSSSPSGCARRRRVPGPGWRRLARGTWGEWATGELLADPEAAEGWGGDRYELWQQRSGDCAAPCRHRDALVMRWRWDTREDARGSRPRCAMVKRADRLAGDSSRGREVALALAPEADLAQRLVE